MIDQKLKKTRREPNHKQLHQLTSLKSEQLEEIAGGPKDSTCPACVFNK